MAISIDNIEKRKQSMEKSAALDSGTQKTRVLRPWESYESEPDLLELVKNKKSKERIPKKAFEKNADPKEEKPKNLGPQEKLKEISKKYFGDLT
jgi:ParB-like chromosome segregation protein Spo0J